jgi:hypothetical protein
LNPRGQIHSLPPLSHSATVTLGARSTSRTCLSGFSDRRLDRNGLPGEFGGRGGNRTLICWLQASGPPIERLPQTWLRAGELNATRMAYEASMTPVHLPAKNLVREAGVEPAASRLSIECSNHAELFPDGAPCQIRTGFSGLQIRRIADYAYRACDSGANGANRTLIGCLPCNCSPVELHRLEPEGVFETPTSALRVRCSST